MSEQETLDSQEKTDSEPQETVNKEAIKDVVGEIVDDVLTEETVTENISVEEVQKQLALAEQKATEQSDKALRIQAEMENLKRRTQKDLENAHKFALNKFSKELLPVIDSLELALQAVEGDSAEMQKVREGYELILKQFEAALKKFNVEQINPMGEAFNPELHQAMTMQPSEDAEPNTVLNVFQKGYSLNGRLIRPAMVVVAKAVENA
ncbi:MAG: nucleotide exchange factor GrpE [Methylococcales bacterium]|nr:nucleotide exchange factor GrpE [Methylococcales bacterium]MCK5897682.1 nucleotide exchange factor GrpE [Methylococcales bacterium]